MAPLDYVSQDTFAAEPASDPARHRAIARVVIALTGLITFVAFALIFYRSVTVREPNSAIVIYGDESYDGAEITVSSTVYPQAVAKLTRYNNFVTPVLLLPGYYTVIIRQNGRTILDQKCKVEGMRGVEFRLVPGKMSATRPSASAARPRGAAPPDERE